MGKQNLFPSNRIIIFDYFFLIRTFLLEKDYTVQNQIPFLSLPCLTISLAFLHSLFKVEMMRYSAPPSVMLNAVVLHVRLCLLPDLKSQLEQHNASVWLGVKKQSWCNYGPSLRRCYTISVKKKGRSQLHKCRGTTTRCLTVHLTSLNCIHVSLTCHDGRNQGNMNFNSSTLTTLMVWTFEIIKRAQSNFCQCRGNFLSLCMFPREINSLTAEHLSKACILYSYATLYRSVQPQCVNRLHCSHAERTWDISNGSNFFFFNWTIYYYYLIISS